MNNSPATRTAPRLAVVIPCYNYGHFLREAVDSVQQAGRGDLELVIVDDGSTDPRTRQELDRLGAEGLRVLTQKNSGVMAARNAGVRATTAAHILPLDADNRVRPAYFTRALAILDDDPAVGIVYGDAQKFGRRADRWTVGPFDRARLMRQNYIDACAVYRRQVWEDTGGYDSSMPVQGLEDWDFWLGAMAAGWKFAYVPEVVFDYRIEAGSLSTRAAAKFPAVEEFIAKKYAGLYRQAWLEMQRDLFSVRATSRNFGSLLYRRVRNRLVRGGPRHADRWAEELRPPR